MDTQQPELEDHGGGAGTSAVPVAIADAAASPLIKASRTLRIEDLPGFIVCKILRDMDDPTAQNFIEAFRQAESINNGECRPGNDSPIMAVSSARAIPNSPGRSRIETLPGEIIHTIMKLMDAEDLLAFIQASKTMYEAYKEAEGLVAHAVCERIIGRELLPIALNCSMAEDLDLQDRIFSSLGSGVIIRVANEFIESLIFSIRARPRFQVISCTKAEKTRILKAMYLFDLLRHLVTPVSSYRDVSLEQAVCKMLRNKMGPWAFCQLKELVEWLLVEDLIDGANRHAGIIYQQGHEAFHMAYPHTRLDAGYGVTCYDCSQATVGCDCKSIISRMTPARALTFLLQHGSGAAKIPSTSQQGYVNMYLSTAWDRFNPVTWPRCEIDDYYIDINVGDARWYLSQDDTPKLIAQRAKAVAEIFDTQDDYVFRMWLWRQIANCDPALEMGNKHQARSVNDLSWGMFFRGKSTMERLGLVPPPVE
ncbi:hypothetical protein LQW54_008526 [Pestalotiopsis sp. IQ-011]